MKKRARLLRSSLVLALLGLGLGLVVACSDQAEGERCELENGDLDCGAGLICVGSAGRPAGRWQVEYNLGLNEPFTGVDRCCPESRTKATHPACVFPTNPGTNVTPPTDSGPDVSVVDAAGDSGADAADAAPVTDASTDAADDGG